VRGDDAVALHVVTAESPLEALKKVISGRFVIRTSEPNWFRVVDERQSEVFSYAHPKSVDLDDPRRLLLRHGLP
jgi:hypothetical protein